MFAEILEPISICCCFCSAERFAALGLFSICWEINSRQSTRWFKAAVARIPITVDNTTGRTQLGLRTMSSKVALGENKTPIIRPRGDIDACGSKEAPGVDAGMVAIEDLHCEDVANRCCLLYAEAAGKVSHPAGAGYLRHGGQKFLRVATFGMLKDLVGCDHPPVHMFVGHFRLVCQNRFFNLLPDAHHRIQRSH